MITGQMVRSLSCAPGFDSGCVSCARWDPYGGLRDIQPVMAEHAARRDANAGLDDEGAQTFGHSGGNLGDQVARGAGQRRIAPFGDPLRAQHRSLELIGREHQWRHVEVATEDVTHPRLALNRRPLSNQIGNIAVNGSRRHFEFIGQRAGGDRAARRRRN